MAVLGIDPGRDKCGLAVVQGRETVIKRVVPRADYLQVAADWVHKFGVQQIVIGDGTGSKQTVAEVRKALPGVPVATVDERFTSEQARKLYWVEHPPRGWRRLLPVSMQVPPEPYDHYVAVILAQRFSGGEG
ncbi:MAG: pre-16S rRNA-processing nuclease YqgF [Firmicutes bacterium]|nr:pre-16S rRNA-processing nuclease YqgF [Bacillota bacterium]